MPYVALLYKQHTWSSSTSPVSIDSISGLSQPSHSGRLNSTESSELCKVPASRTVPIESSWSPTSNDSLSVRDLDVFKQVKYW